MAYTNSGIKSEDRIIRAGVILLSSFAILCIFITACGRRTDPVYVPSYDEKNDSQDNLKAADSHAGTGAEEGAPDAVKENEEKEDVKFSQPSPPEALAAVYTGKSIILTWREIMSRGVMSYRVFRSSDDVFVLVGETVSPAFTDRDVTPGQTYSYKVTAFGQSEGPASEEISISTEIDGQ